MARVLVAANFKTGLGVVKNTWRTKANDIEKDNYRHITTYQRLSLLIALV